MGLQHSSTTPSPCADAGPYTVSFTSPRDSKEAQFESKGASPRTPPSVGVVGGCGLGLTRSLDRIGQTLVGECTNLCDIRVKGMNEYLPLYQGDDTKEQLLICRNTSNEVLNHKKILEIIKLDGPAPNTFWVPRDSEDTQRNDYLDMAEGAVTLADRLTHLCSAIRCSQSSFTGPGDSTQLRAFSNAKPLQASDSLLARSLGMDDLIYELEGGNERIYLDPKDAPLFHEIGLLLISSLRQELLPIAVAAFVTARTLDYENESYHVNAAQAAMRLGRHPTVIRDLEAGIRRLRGSSMLYFHMGIAIQEHDKTKKSLELSLQHLREALRLDPQNQEFLASTAGTLEVLACCHQGTNRTSLLAEALQYYKKADQLVSSPQIQYAIQTLEGRIQRDRHLPH